jgi:hypothetical protein
MMKKKPKNSKLPAIGVGNVWQHNTWERKHGKKLPAALAKKRSAGEAESWILKSPQAGSSSLGASFPKKLITEEK